MKQETKPTKQLDLARFIASASEGRTRDEIAAFAGIDKSQVPTYIYNLRGKVKVELVAEANAQGRYRIEMPLDESKFVRRQVQRVTSARKSETTTQAEQTAAA